MTKPNDAQATQAASPKQAEPMFWVRLCSNGAYEGPIHNAEIQRVLRDSGVWRPLFLGATPQPAVSAQELSDERILSLHDMQVGEPTARHPLTAEDWICFARAVLAAARAQQAPQAGESQAQAIGAEGQWRWVPTEPTQEMTDAGLIGIGQPEGVARTIYRNMIAAAPGRAATPAGEGA
jgi:hypothetical protein